MAENNKIVFPEAINELSESYFFIQKLKGSFSSQAWWAEKTNYGT